MSAEFDQLLLQEQERNVFLEVVNNDDGDIIDIVSGDDTTMEELIDSLDDEDLDFDDEDEGFFDESCFGYEADEKLKAKPRKGGIF
jgi:hypothetical protein